MDIKTARKVTCGQRVKYAPDGAVGTVDGVRYEHPDPRAKPPLFHVRYENGVVMPEVTHQLLDLE